MRVRPYGPVLLVLAAVAATLVGASPAAAKVPPVTGSVRCTISSPVITFNPGLRNRIHAEGKQKGRGPSATTVTATLGSCTTPALGPAPGGIDHGTLVGNGKIGGSYCEKLDRLKLKTTVTWRKADNTIVGSTAVKLEVDVHKPSFTDPWTLDFAGTAKGSSSVFPRDLVLFYLVTTMSNQLHSARCFHTQLDSLAFTDDTFTADATG